MNEVLSIHRRYYFIIMQYLAFQFYKILYFDYDHQSKFCPYIILFYCKYCCEIRHKFRQNVLVNPAIVQRHFIPAFSLFRCCKILLNLCTLCVIISFKSFKFLSASWGPEVLDELIGPVDDWVIMLFFSVHLLRNYKMFEVETWLAIAVWYKDDANIFYLNKSVVNKF